MSNRTPALALCMLLACVSSFPDSAGSQPINLSPVNIDSIYRDVPAPERYRQYGYIYLLDKGDIEVFADFSSVRTYHSIALVTSQEGIENLGTEVVTYELGHDSVIVDNAVVTSPAGVRTAVDSSHIIDNIRPSNLMENNLYTSTRQVRVLFSGLEVGSTVELRYSIVTYAPSYRGFSERWSFSLSVPSRLSVYAVAYPSAMPLRFKTYNLSEEGGIVEDAGRTVRAWVRSDIPAQMQEPNGLPFWDLAEHVDCTSFDSWAEFGRYLYDSLWSADLNAPLDSCERGLLEGLSLSNRSSRERVSAIFHAVQQRFRYLGLSIGEHNLKPHPSRAICEARYGDCKDKSNLLVKLLRHEGIECYPVVLATWGRIYDLDTSFAAISYLNHACVYIPDPRGTAIWLDPTLEFAASGLVEPTLVNRWALVVDDDRNGLQKITTTPREANFLSASSTTRLDTTGTGTGSTEYRYTGWRAAQMRNAISAMNEDERRHLCVGGPSVSILECTLDNLEPLDTALVIRVRHEDRMAAELAGDLMIVADQFSIMGITGIEELRPDRSLDLHLPYLVATRSVATYDAPEGFEVKSTPAGVSLSCENVTFEQTVQKISARSVRISRAVEVQAMFVPVSRYNVFREFIQTADKASNEKLVFQKSE